MSLGTAVERIAEINGALTPPRPEAPAATGGGNAVTGSLAAPAGTSFASLLGQTSSGGGALAAAQGEIGQAEQPPGSNNSPRIAQYREAVPGGGVGPWCAYFVSWAALQGGVPLGPEGQGFASVDALYEWAQQSGRAVPAAAGPPSPGDLIVWDEHIGIVEAVLPDGSIRTIEGNSSDRVERNQYGADGGGAIGWVRLG